MQRETAAGRVHKLVFSFARERVGAVGDLLLTDYFTGVFSH